MRNSKLYTNTRALNILLLGPTGEGKTSLKNIFFNLNLEAEFGKPTTLEIKPYY